MYEYDEYNEEEDEVFSREGGIFQIDTSDLKEVRRFRENVRKSNKFNIIKLNERSDDKMDDSAYNDDRNLKDLAEDFLDEEIGDFEKNIVLLPEKLKTALEEAYKILIAYKSELEEIPELLSAVQLMARIATGKPGKEPEPGKYPYPTKKVEKSMNWSQVQDMLFGGHIGPADDEEIEKSSKENPFPSITRALKIRKEAIDEVESELEQDAFDPDDRTI
jgi:hypothetical protein